MYNLYNYGVLTFIALKLCSIFIRLPNIPAKDIFISVYFGLFWPLAGFLAT